MVIETYIDLQDLSSNQKLVILDDYGKRWDVETALRDAYDGYDGPGEQLRQHSIVLERWTLQLDQPPNGLESDYEKTLPAVYKNSIILYRSLYAYLKFMPAWKFFKRGSKGLAGQPMPKLKWRIFDPSRRPADGSPDDLTLSLFTGQPQITEHYAWDPTESPAGRFSVEVTFRNNCDFRIDTPESLFNDQFMAHDEQLFEPSLPQSGVLGARRGSIKPRPTEMGSLPTESKDLPNRKKLDEITEQGPAYGSMSTFHNAGGKIATSPLSALRAARELYGKSPQDSPPHTAGDSGPNVGSDASFRSNQAAPGMARRTSISFNPFKAPAFSSSVPVDHSVPASPRVSSSINRPSPLGPLNEARHPSQSSQTQISPLTSPRPADIVPVPASHSPRPAPARFSSSFSHRKNRLSIGGASSKTEDDTSSGRGSVSSSNVQTGPPGEVTGANSLQTDDDNISDFLKMLDQKKELKSFTKPVPASAASGSQALRGTTAGLSRFQHMRDSHVALSDSISSSQMLQRSSVSSASRQLANVPPMVAGTSASLSSSPGERMSPRTPHTPAIPSRLSSNSIIEYNQDARRPRGHRYSTGEDVPLRERAEEGDSAAARDAGAIPIPNSPRFGPQYRRSSSAANQHNRERNRADRYDAVDNYDDILPFALRSASMGDGEEREPLSLSALLRMQDTSGPIPTGVLPPSTELDDDMGGESVHGQDPATGRGDAAGRNMSYRARGHGRVSSLAHEERTPASTASSSASRPGTGRSGSGSMEGRPPGRHSFMRSYGNANFEDDEPLLFAMSEQLEGSGGTPGGGSGSGSGSGNGRERRSQW